MKSVQGAKIIVHGANSVILYNVGFYGFIRLFGHDHDSQGQLMDVAAH